MPSHSKEKKVNRFTSANHDSEHSKFKHLIYFGDKNIVLTGYSGKVGMREKDNEIDNFINYVLRLMKSSYYPGSSRNIDSIEFFENADNMKIVSLHRGYPMWEPLFAFEPKWKRVDVMLNTMYDLLEKKWPLTQIEDKLKIKNKPKVAFDPHDMTPRFTNDRALLKYCEELLQKRYPQGEVELYLRNYRNKFFTTTP